MKQKLLIIKKQAIKRKNNWNFFLRNTCKLNKSNYLCTRNQEITDSQIRIDSVAQQVEHNTFNVGVLGSSPSWITEIREQFKFIFELFFFIPIKQTIKPDGNFKPNSR